MRYEDLTLLQRIGLKGFIENEKELAPLKAIWILWGFKKAVEYFLNEDISALTIQQPCQP